MVLSADCCRHAGLTLHRKAYQVERRFTKKISKLSIVILPLMQDHVLQNVIFEPFFLLVG